jgi:hypothetical protein
VVNEANSERLLLKIAKRGPDLALILPPRLGHIGRKSIIATVSRTTMGDTGMKADLMKADLIKASSMRPALMKASSMKAALGLLSAVVSAWFTLDPAAAADMPGNPPPPPTGYYGPPVEEGYAVPPPVYAYPAPPVYRYYAVPPVAYVPRPYYARPYYGFYGPWRYPPYWAAGRYRGYYR